MPYKIKIHNTHTHGDPRRISKYTSSHLSFHTLTLRFNLLSLDEKALSDRCRGNGREGRERERERCAKSGKC